MIGYLFTQLLIVLFGLAVILHPSTRALGWPARLALAFISGSVLLTIEAVALSFAGVSWGERTLPLPFIVAIVFAMARWRRTAVDRLGSGDESSGSRKGMILASIVIAISLIHLLAAIVSSRSNSPEHLREWGARGSRYANARSLEADFMRQPVAAVLSPSQPPLVPLTQAWSDIALKRETIEATPYATLLWITATALLAFALLRRWLTTEESLVTVAFWLASLSIATVALRLSGAADAAVACFATLSAIGLAGRAHRLYGVVATFALAGLALSRWDGVVLAAIFIVAHLVPLARERKLGIVILPVMAAALWLAVVTATGLTPFPLGDGESFWRVVTGSPMAALSGGTYFLSLALPLLLLAQARRRGRVVRPTTVAIAAAFVALPLLSPLVAQTRDASSVARALLPITSVVIMAAASATLGRPDRHRAMAPAPRSL